MAEKKGELADLRNQLRNLAGSNKPGVVNTKRELFKKVINYMTMNIDVSSLFSEMLMAGATSDVILKKMLYLYISTYASSMPELSLLTVNALQKVS